MKVLGFATVAALFSSTAADCTFTSATFAGKAVGNYAQFSFFTIKSPTPVVQDFENSPVKIIFNFATPRIVSFPQIGDFTETNEDYSYTGLGLDKLAKKASIKSFVISYNYNGLKVKVPFGDVSMFKCNSAGACSFAAASSAAGVKNTFSGTTASGTWAGDCAGYIY